MILADFKQLVLDYMNREGVTFDVDTPGKPDKVLEAVNNAKAYAQKLIRFEKARTYAQVSVSKTGGGDLNSAVLLDGITPCRVRNIEQGFVLGNDGAYYNIDVISRGKQLEDMDYWVADDGYNPKKTSLRCRVIKDGDTLWLDPWPSEIADTATIRLRVIQWMPEYSSLVTAQGVGQPGTIAVGAWTLAGLTGTGNTFETYVKAGSRVNGAWGSAIITQVGYEDLALFVLYATTGSVSIFDGTGTFTFNGVDSDFFLVEGREWLLYRTIQELNFFLKEDQRVALSSQVVKESWEALKSWNADFAGTGSVDID